MKISSSKKRWRLLALIMCLTMALTLAFGACAPKKDEGDADPDTPPITQPDDSDKKDDNKEEEKKPEPEVWELTYRSGYTPEKFSGVKGEVTDLAEGVHLVKNTMTKSNGDACVVWTIEVNLNYAGIAAGTKDNKSYGFNWVKATPYAMAQAWEADNEGEQVFASINADFFGSYTVNAFVKDSYIIKAGHNDKGTYDYKNDDADVPASAPMLFGVKGTKAQIAPIIKVDGDPKDAAVKEQLIKAELYYKVDGNKKCIVKQNAAPSDQHITLQTAETEPTVSASGVAVKVDTSKGFQNLKVLEKLDKITAGQTGLAVGDGYAWLVATGLVADGVTYLKSLKVGDSISLSVASAGGTWDGYETILGTRQALVIDNEVASTVTLENSNAAQSRDIPRTAIGIKSGRVVLFAVESLYYGKKALDGDTHGMNLPELAEFAYYYGCSAAANFDGGGSTQLAVRGKDDAEAKVLVRSSDTGSTALSSTRVVMNGFLITSKKGK